MLARIGALFGTSSGKRACLFCDICEKKEAATIHYEDADCVVIDDIYPAAERHYLVIPKRHIATARDLEGGDIDLILKMQEIGRKVLEEHDGDWSNCRRGFHWPPFYSVAHLHMHIISPESQIYFTKSMTFKKDSFWFRSTDTILADLREKSRALKADGTL